MLCRVGCVVLLFVVMASVHAVAQESVAPTADVLPGTDRLELVEPLHAVMVEGIGKFAERELDAARKNRSAPWLTAPDPEAAKAAARERLREAVGARDLLATVFRNGFIHVQSNPDLPAPAASEQGVTRFLSRWDVSEGLTGEGWIFNAIPSFFDAQREQQKNPPIILLLATPEQIQHENWRLPKLISSTGATVISPVLVGTKTDLSGHPDIRQTNLTHREYLYRLGFNLGRHPVGYDIERTLTSLQLLKSNFKKSGQTRKIILVGTGDGAVVAQNVAAIAPELIDAVVLHGDFGPPEVVWQEPISRNVFGQLTNFGDAELASLMLPAHVVIEAGQLPDGDSPPEPKVGEAKIAAPGMIKSPELSEVKKEFERAAKYFELAGNADKLHLVEEPQHACAPETVEILNASLGLEMKVPDVNRAEESKFPELDEEFLKAQQERLMSESVRHTQMLLARADKVRAKLWHDVDLSSVEVWEQQADTYRELVHTTFIGKLDPPTAPPSPRSRKVINEQTHVGYEVVLDVYPAPQGSENDPGVIAGGILLLPKDLKAGERRPVVVCQHGLEGTPMDTITTDPNDRAFAPYKGFSTQLVKRGFIVYAPQNPYKGYDDFRVLQRKSNPLGRSLFSYIIEQHRQTLNWLGSLSYVDANRIGFYGLSYGGKTAMRVPPLLPPKGDFPGYCLSICSADFNEWIRKNASAEDKYSYVYTPEYEIFEWNMGHIANYAELAWLMAPRPFMVERGHDDGVAPDEWVGWEYAKVRRHYDKLGIGDKTEIEWFNGPHTINGQGTFELLHRHLNWPQPE